MYKNTPIRLLLCNIMYEILNCFAKKLIIKSNVFYLKQKIICYKFFKNSLFFTSPNLSYNHLEVKLTKDKITI